MSQSASPTDADPTMENTTSQEWFRLSAEEVASHLGVTLSEGLSRSEAQKRLRRVGPNRLRETRTVSWHHVLTEQFKNVIMALLAGAALVSFVIGDTVEALAIVVVMILNGGIGFLTEYRANRAMEALQKLGSQAAVLLRDGHRQARPATDIAPGDIIILEEGQGVPADARLVECADLRVDESALTGESVAVQKELSPIDDPETPLAERTNMVYRGTNVRAGNGVAVVVATGMDTEIGRVSELVGGIEDEKTPLEKRLATLARKLIFVCLGVAVIIAIAGIVQGVEIWEMVKAAIALAIAAIPEGLPAVATITLAAGMKRMARRNALVRRLPAVETLGSCTCVCTDKTGTLTRGEMTLRALSLPGRELTLTGGGYAPDGELLDDDKTVDAQADRQIRSAFFVAALCNNASLNKDDEGAWQITGDPTEAALLTGALKTGWNAQELQRKHSEKREYPFSSETMMMGTVNENLLPSFESGNGLVLSVKGAPLRVLGECNRVLTPHGEEELNRDRREEIDNRNRELASKGMRVLGLAYRTVNNPSADRSEACSNLTWVGLAGLVDPPRKEAAETVDTMKEAGIHTVMITGDQPETARNIAVELDITPPDGPVMTGRELDKLDDHELKGRLANTEVFCRVSPEQKLRLLRGLQGRGDICAMLGDGVNDAAALKSADIGVAMGIRGTDVAKETADMVLLDDMFTTIGAAIYEGRVIYDNIKKFISYLFSCNLSEILTMLFASLLGHPLPLLPLQILWLNLITDVFPALALAAEPGEPNIMKRAPANPENSLVGRAMGISIGLNGLLITIPTVAVFMFGILYRGYNGVNGANPAITMSFLTIGFGQLFHVFNCRKLSGPVRGSEWVSNHYMLGAFGLTVGLMLAAVYVPILQRVLKTVPPVPVDWAVILAGASTPLIVGQAVDWVQLWRRGGEGIRASNPAR